MIRTDLGHFWIEFENGYEISVFNGFGSYTENHFEVKLLDRKKLEMPIASKECEIAIMYKDKFVTRKILNSQDDVVGYVSPTQLAEIIDKVSKLEAKE